MKTVNEMYYELNACKLGLLSFCFHVWLRCLVKYYFQIILTLCFHLAGRKFVLLEGFQLVPGHWCCQRLWSYPRVGSLVLMPFCLIYYHMSSDLSARRRVSSEIWSLPIVSVTHAHVNVNAFSLQNVIMLSVPTLFQLRLLVETNTPSEV